MGFWHGYTPAGRERWTLGEMELGKEVRYEREGEVVAVMEVCRVVAALAEMAHR